MTEPRIIGHMVTRNELGRYLPETYEWLAHITGNQPVVYDDGSTDGTVDYLRGHDARLKIRDDDDPSFEESESRFRQNAWNFLERAVEPRDGDWILCVDADEFIVSTNEKLITPDALYRCAVDGLVSGIVAYSTPVEEVFGIDPDGNPLIRTDGWWSTITATRFVRWFPAGRFDDRQEGGGSVPGIYLSRAVRTERLTFVHLGYARATDRIEKYRRHAAAGGHNPTHVESIMGTPQVTRSRLPIPSVIREALR